MRNQNFFKNRDFSLPSIGAQITALTSNTDKDTSDDQICMDQFLWAKPASGMLKLNVDDAFLNKTAAAGMILRDSNGNFLFLAGYLSTQLSPLNVELWAIIKGLQLFEKL